MLSPKRVVLYEELVQLLQNLVPPEGGGNSESEVWINTSTPPEKVGGFELNEPATPEEGLSFPQAMNKLLFPALPPNAAIVLAGPSFPQPFNQQNVQVQLNITYSPRTAGATITSAILQRKRGNDSFIQINSNVPTGTFTDSPLNGNDSIQYRLIVTDSSNAVRTVDSAIFNFSAYTTPTISISPTALDTPPAGFTIANIGTNRLTGMTSTRLSITFTKTSPNVNLTSYTVTRIVNGVSTPLTGLPSLTGNTQTIQIDDISPLAVEQQSIQYNVSLSDGVQTVNNSAVVNQFFARYYGASSSVINTGAGVKALPLKDIGTTKEFTLNGFTGASVVVAYRESLGTGRFEALVAGQWGPAQLVNVTSTVISVTDYNNANPVGYIVYQWTPTTAFNNTNVRFVSN